MFIIFFKLTNRYQNYFNIKSAIKLLGLELALLSWLLLGSEGHSPEHLLSL